MQARKEASAFGQKANAEAKGRPRTEPLLRFPWERQTRKEFRIGWFE